MKSNYSFTKNIFSLTSYLRIIQSLYQNLIRNNLFPILIGIVLLSNTCLASNYSQVLGVSPDLTISAFSLNKTNFSVGEIFFISATVRNNGTSDSDVTTLRYRLSTNSFISIADPEIANASIPILSPAASVSRGVNRTVLMSGTYWVAACVDTVAGEAVTNNNCSAGTQITVTDAPELRISMISLSKPNLFVGEIFTINETVLNEGTLVAGQTVLSYRQSNNSIITVSDPEIGTSSIVSLGAGVAIPVSYDSSIMSAGDFWIGVCVDTVTNEGNPNNNCSQGIPVTVVNAPELIVNNFTLSNTSLGVGELYTISATVLNVGNLDSGATILRYRQSTNSTITTFDPEIGSNEIINLTSASSVSFNIQSSVMTADDFWIAACVDTVSGENNPGNNCSTAIHITVVDAPELRVENLTLNKSLVEVGELLSIDEMVINAGSLSSDATTLRYRLSTNSTISGFDLEITTDNLTTLSAGTSLSISKNLSLSDVGTFWLGACVDTVAGEGNANDNCSAGVKIKVVSTPRVEINSGEGFPDDTILLDIIFKNDGSTDEMQFDLLVPSLFAEIIDCTITSASCSVVSNCDPAILADEARFSCQNNAASAISDGVIGNIAIHILPGTLPNNFELVANDLMFLSNGSTVSPSSFVEGIVKVNEKPLFKDGFE